MCNMYYIILFVKFDFNFVVVVVGNFEYDFSNLVFVEVWFFKNLCCY